MSTSMVLCDHLKLINQYLPQASSLCVSCRNPSCFIFHLSCERKRFSGFVANAANNNSNYSKKRKRKRSWWQRFFFDDDGNWLGLKDDDMLEEGEDEFSESEELSGGDKFEAWKRRAEAIMELREAQEDMRNEESRRWEDWIVVGDDNKHSAAKDWDDDGRDDDWGEDKGDGLVKSVRDLVLGREDEDILYEDRVFRYASLNSAKFVAALVLIPCALDFVVHDYVLMPFLDRYVKTVPLAAEMLDVRRSQKLEMVKQLKVEKARFRFEVEIGKSPPLSDEELWWELRHKALELRDEFRLENRKAFANIWSDMVFGISLFLLLHLNQSKVALMKFAGYKIISNISDTGKAFLIILSTDIFLGYHSESGWQTLLEIIVEHYGLQVDQSAITVFVCLIPVVMDACVKLWLFKFLPRLSPGVANIFQEMKRH
ncbi:chloroplast envelope membrane protein isoform X1 [Herrania umbratica]|uniref:Chloroplast envelope membrane protein isoform X1 n=1 Tax=Herrania umbratica TaxID=108875 RepID=A0A6J0ZUL9_9ROSI|nr:chloroplast envelope membrane protein isoform X1 [Herrania umbratica]